MKLIWILTSVTFLVVDCVRIEENGYKEVTFSFSEKSQREDFDFVKLKEVLTKASAVLFNATRKRSYFEEFVLVIPPTWSDTDGICDRNGTVPKNIDIYVTESSRDPTLTTRHSKGCGHKGDIIHMPAHWLKGKAKAEDLALEFVQQWSTFQYGVFTENPESSDSCVATSDSTWSPVGCFNIDLNVDIASVQFDKSSGLPLCKFPINHKDSENFRSSIMFSANTLKMLDFCDGSETLPHNPIFPTLHNRICEGKSVWSVIKNTDDFKYGRNSPRNDLETPPNIPKFSCFKERKTHITLAMQDSNLEGRNEVRYSLFNFLSIMEPADFAIGLAIFSNESLTESASSVEVNLKDVKQIKSLLDSQLNLNEEVPNICLICGLRKAYEVSTKSQFSKRTVILFAQESSLENTITSALTEIVQSDTDVVLYFLFLEDTDTDIIPLSLEEAVQNSGGKIFRVKNKAVYMLTEINVALLDATGDKLQNEDKILVVHKKVYENVKSDFTDAFLTPKATSGRLFYSLQCQNRGDVISVNNICTDKDARLQSPVCGNEVDVTADSDSKTKWQYGFKFGGNKGTTCLSLALLKLQSSSTASFTVKGWLSKNKIIPGQDALIIYAETFGSMDQNIIVEARIFGPGLPELYLQLRDNGNGDPDVIKGDNIYSRYFTAFIQKGIYTVSIYVKTQVADANSYSTEKSDEFATTQMKTVGTFTVMQPPPTEDIYPPNRVSDLTVVAINNTNRMVSLQWTAPGDDYDSGTASKYKVYFTDDWRNLEESLTNKIPTSTLDDTSNLLPNTNGNIEQREFLLPNSSLPIIYYMALKAIDKSGNEGKLSNTVQLPMNYEDISEGNLTNINDTKVIDNLKEDSVLRRMYWHIIIGSLLGIIIIIIIINIFIWILCFRKYKNTNKAVRIKDTHGSNTKHYRMGNDINSDEKILSSENNDANTQDQRQSEEIVKNPDTTEENFHTSNPLITYAKVEKRNKNEKFASPTFCDNESPQTQHRLNHRERDLGYV